REGENEREHGGRVAQVRGAGKSGVKPETPRLEQFTNETSELLCKDLRANPCRETGAGGHCPP
ncbi:MAG: hypothetical protein LBS65_09425, partial [Desulfovibrio sp.]|nr:hypothetical protein [Desulfovibrio sp.]